ncbi:hypothetical protein Btru_033899 [Bulinus truncatus]|nr:hypothetical protein Btru_033899 [Bulinus truncatus]
MSERDEIWPKQLEEDEDEEKPATLVPELIASVNVDVSSLRAPQDLDGAFELSESHGEIDLQTDEHNQFIDLDEVSILQAVVFIEDACQYRTINHKIGPRHLWIYRKYQSFPVVVFRFVVIFALHMLAFLEHPSSLTITSDLRIQGPRPLVPCWVTQFLEFIFLSLLVMDNALRASTPILHTSEFIFDEENRKMFTENLTRGFQVKITNKTMTYSVNNKSSANSGNDSDITVDEHTSSSMQTSLVRRRLAVRAAFEVLTSKFFRNTSNSHIRPGIGTSVIKRIVQDSDLPNHVNKNLIEKLNKEPKIYSTTQFQELFLCLDDDVIHKQVQLGAKFDSSFRENHSTLRIFNFTFVMYYLFEQLIKVWANGWRRYIAVRGNIFDAVITAALVIGETVSAFLFGLPYFPSSQEISEVSLSTTMWNILRIVNILIMVRLFKAIPHIKSMAVITTVLVDLLKNLKAFAGILVAIFYTFAIFGMQLFHGAIKYQPDYVNKTFACGTYEQLNYWSNNFDDFYSSLIVLWDLMVVNNWNVFLKVYRTKTTSWSYLYFIVWWLLSVIIVVNLFTALIMENFIIRWDRRRRISQIDTLDASYYEHLTISVHLNNVHNMFKDLLQEPDETELLQLLREHRFLKLEG